MRIRTTENRKRGALWGAAGENRSPRTCRPAPADRHVREDRFRGCRSAGPHAAVHARFGEGFACDDEQPEAAYASAYGIPTRRKGGRSHVTARRCAATTAFTALEILRPVLVRPQ